MRFNKKLILEDGSVYPGAGFGADRECVAELVFNTGPVGYQEIISDNSYCGQMLVMCYPLIGNYGICAEDFESAEPHLQGLIVKEHCTEPSNFRTMQTLDSFLREKGIPGISGIDTRQLTRAIRDKGAMKAMITDIGAYDMDAAEKLRAAKLFTDHVRRVSTQAVRRYEGGGLRVAVIDCGVKENIIRSLHARGCGIAIFPYNTEFAEIEKYNPDGILFSNGPGNPEDAKEVIDTARAASGKYVVFGICLGMQILALTFGAKTYKMKFGHRGCNHPIRNTANGRIEITSQNHSYAVVPDSLAGTGLEMTHYNVLDNSIEGIRHTRLPLFAVQYHPESAPGPQDSQYLFDRFIALMEKRKGKQ